MSPEEVRLLYEYNSWANRRVLDCCTPLTPEQFAQRIESSFPSVRETLVHICAAEWIWLERWKGHSPAASEWQGFGRDLTDLARLRTYWSELEARLMDFVTGLTAERLAGPLEVRTTDGTPYTQPLWQMMQHLANHGTYHRGQVTTMLRQLGAKPVPLDLIRFYRERGAAAR